MTAVDEDPVEHYVRDVMIQGTMEHVLPQFR